MNPQYTAASRVVRNLRAPVDRVASVSDDRSRLSSGMVFARRSFGRASISRSVSTTTVRSLADAISPASIWWATCSPCSKDGCVALARSARGLLPTRYMYRYRVLARSPLNPRGEMRSISRTKGTGMNRVARADCRSEARKNALASVDELAVVRAANIAQDRRSVRWRIPSGSVVSPIFSGNRRCLARALP